jgi:hypothetical protein
LSSIFGFGVLKQADPALVDPGATAQLECLLDDVVVGNQEMIGAIDAVCDVAQRIIGKLKAGAGAGGPPLLGAADSNGAGGYPPTPAIEALCRQPRPAEGHQASSGLLDIDLPLQSFRRIADSVPVIADSFR